MVLATVLVDCRGRKNPGKPLFDSRLACHEAQEPQGDSQNATSEQTPLARGVAQAKCVISQTRQTTNATAQIASPRMNRFDGPPSALR